LNLLADGPLLRWVEDMLGVEEIFELDKLPKEMLATLQSK
jgi:hypothetical protein